MDFVWRGNVGHQSAIMAGMMTARDFADAVVTIDADLQDDLAAVEEMIDRYLEGYDIVYGVKVSRTADPLLKRTSALAFYRLQSAMAFVRFTIMRTPSMSRRALDALACYPERNLYLRGIIPQLGYASTISMTSSVSASLGNRSTRCVRCSCWR